MKHCQELTMTKFVLLTMLHRMRQVPSALDTPSVRDTDLLTFAGDLLGYAANDRHGLIKSLIDLRDGGFVSYKKGRVTMRDIGAMTLEIHNRIICGLPGWSRVR